MTEGWQELCEFFGGWYGSLRDWLGRDPILVALEHVGTFAGAISGVRLASIKRFDWFGAYVIGFVTALGGGTLRDVLLPGVTPFWMSSPSFLVTTLAAVVAVWLFGRQFISGQVTWYIFDTIAIALFMIIGLEKSLVNGQAWWCAIIMGVITAVFGGILRDVCINEVPLIFRKEIYALACAAGGFLYFVLLWCGMGNPLPRVILSIVLIFALRALAIKYHLGVPVLTGHTHFMHHHLKSEKKKHE